MTHAWLAPSVARGTTLPHTVAAADSIRGYSPPISPSVRTPSPAAALLPGARRFSELLARPQTDRVVIRGGVAREDTALPAYSELDHLVDGPVAAVDLSRNILRGATKA